MQGWEICKVYSTAKARALADLLQGLSSHLCNSLGLDDD
jgi:hypothetical protein